MSTTVHTLLPGHATDERPARRTLLDQIERLETELSDTLAATWPRKGFSPAVAGAGGGPRLLTLGELEEQRDTLAEKVAGLRRQFSDRTQVEEEMRAQREDMLLDPAAHRWTIISNEDIGEPGCKHWHVRPRFGIIGMFLNWWRVRISSGCPLAARLAAADP